MTNLQSTSFLPMKIKPSSVIKIAHAGSNHYFQVTDFACRNESDPEIKVVSRGLAFTLFRSSQFGWTQKDEPVRLDIALLNQLGMVPRSLLAEIKVKSMDRKTGLS